nr:CRISPR-associated helicase Cas3' [Ardenticatena sp.]
MASGFYSHPGVPLEAHSNRVLALARRLLDESAPAWWQSPCRRALLEMAIALHDFGKATRFFQDALRGERGKDAFTRHAKLSALFFLFRATAWLGNEAETEWLALLFAYLAVLRHHTNLRNVADELLPPDERDLEVLEAQIQAIPPEGANAYLAALGLPAEVRAALRFEPAAFQAWLRDDAPAMFRRWRRNWRPWKREAPDAEAYFAFLAAFSALLDADKLEAGAKAHLPARVDIPADAVDRYKALAFGTSSPRGLNVMRERAYHEVLAGLLSPDEHLYTLTLPTGMGKTLTGLAAALRLRDLVREATGHTPRIIYALPFLSIIDQNAATLEQVLATTLGVARSDAPASPPPDPCDPETQRERLVESRLLVKHHHLADVQYRERVQDEIRELDYAASRLLTEGWHAEIVVTTFVQLFDTLLAWRNATARRVNKVHGAILLLDEVQALPAVYWPLVRCLLTEAAERLGVSIILMTATQPYLLENARELVPHPEVYFTALDRLDVHVHLERQTLDEFVDRFVPKAGKSYLFMVNTIAAAQRLHELLSEVLDEEVLFLSTGVTPRERLARIQALKAGRYRFAVSTQLIEAGVDVDFDVIYRDLAPLDSLVQAAGRCNRNLRAGRRGEFHIVHWVDEEGRSYAHWIYDPVLLERTKKRLEGFQHLREPEFLELVGTYFRDVWETGIPWDVADALWDAVRTLRFDGERDRPCVLKAKDAAGAYISQFCLIEQQPYKRDVFVQVDETAVAVWKEAKTILRDLCRGGKVWNARERFARIKPCFYQYVVNVPLKPDTAPHWDDELRMYVVQREVREVYYDPVTGFKRDHEDGGVFF